MSLRTRMAGRGLLAAAALAGLADLGAAGPAAPAPATAGSGSTRVRAVPAANSWGRATEVPGLGALNKGGAAGVSSVSCASPGNCAAGGFSADRRGHQQGFVVSQWHGRWAKAIEVPGLGALTGGGFAAVRSVSCGSAGNCAAGGYYTNRRGQQGFVVSEKNGRWSTAIQVPGLRALNTGGAAEVRSASCGSAGNCAAGGTYADRRGSQQGFVVSEKNGRWSTAIQAPGLAALNTGGNATVLSVSCGSAGNCAAGGYYTNRRGQQGFVVSERNGHWSTAIQVPGLAALSTGGDAAVLSVSCASAGNCAAGGFYLGQGFVVSERNGHWGTAIQAPGLAALNTGGDAAVFSVSCASAGNCAAGGFYLGQGFVVSERNGHWGTAIQVPGLAALNTGGDAAVFSVSCASAGNCAAGGGYSDGFRNGQAFVVSERHGTWGKAIKVPGSAALNKGGNAEVSSVSCASPDNCAAGGSYGDRRFRHQGFVLSQT